MAPISNRLRDKLHQVIFETDTPLGKAFDTLLIVMILSNSLLAIAESVEGVRLSYGTLITLLAWFFIGFFTVEYLIRLYVVKNRLSYLLSFFGGVDLLAILPLFLAFLLPQIRFLVIIRIFRLLRLFSILKMGRYIDESRHLVQALRASKPKITVFLFTIVFIVMIVGSLMYMIEGPDNGFTNIPESMYWAVVTISTVGYGDISPQTSVGKLVSSILMIIGYGIIAVPTGIISHELAKTSRRREVKTCASCNSEFYAVDDQFCSKCGKILDLFQ